MIAYKAFNPGLVCLGYKFKMGLNKTDKANCRQNGFHCAENPLDCLTYYSNMNQSEYCIVNADGDIDEDEHDSKIACTELNIIKKLSREEFFLHALAYINDHPYHSCKHVMKNKANAHNGYAVVRGKDPVACGQFGDILAIAKEAPRSKKIIQIAYAKVDGKEIMPEKWYDIDLLERTDI